jgi:hypothetical protein
MTDADPDALADVGYGIFEHLLNKGLREQGKYLFSLVEQGVDFRKEFDGIFSRFAEEYPQLAEALAQRFPDITTIYTMILSGEGVIPSKTTKMYWIVQDASDSPPEAIEDEKAGKWLIFLEPDQVDVSWEKVRDATVEGALGISTKVSTAKPNPESRDNMKVIYVYTKD